MDKKMFAFGGLAISFVIGLYCFISSFSAFAASSISNNQGSMIAYGVGYMLVGSLLIVLAIAGIVFLVISLIKKKEFKVPIPAIAVLACAAVLFLGHDIMVMVNEGTTISNCARYAGDASGELKTYYVMTILTSLLAIFINLAITIIVAALGVFSLINIKRKKAEPKSELD